MESRPAPRIWDRLGSRLLLTIALFLLVLALTTAMTITVGFRRTEWHAGQHAVEVLEEHARQELARAAEREAGLAANVAPGELAAYLEALRPAPGGTPFVLLADGAIVPAGLPLVATPSPELAGLLSAMRGGQAGATSLAPPQGGALAPQGGTLAPSQGGALAPRDGLLVGYAPVPGRDWSLAIAVPRDELVGTAAAVSEAINSDASPTVRLTLAVMTAWFVLALVITALLSRISLTRPIEALAAGTRAVAAGDLSVRISSPSRDELGLLAASFNTMTARLAEVDRQLELEIEQHRQAEQSLREKEAQYRDIFEATSDGLVINALDGQVVEANPAFCLMHGYEREKVLGAAIASFVHPDYHGLVGDILRVGERGEFFQVQAVNVRRDGSLFHVEVHASPFVWRGQPHVLAAVRDVSERAEARHMLEQRVAARTRELSALYDVTAVASASLDLDTVLERSLDRVLDVMACQAGGVHLVDEEQGELRLAWWQNTVPGAPGEGEMDRVTGRLVRRVFDSGQSLVVPDISAHAPGPGTGPRTYVGAPVHAKGQTLGVLSVVGRPDRRFGAEEVALLASIADQIGVAVDNARLHRHAARLAVVEERERLARDLHDSVTQSLYSANLMVETASRAVRQGELNEVRRMLGRVGEVVQSALKEMRLLVYELRPRVLEDEGLVAALQKRLDAVEGRSGVEARLLVEGDVELAPQAEMELYRIAQEALNNALKHARASSVVVRLVSSADGLVLEVVDDGCGFLPGAPGESGGMGLETMRQRAARLGGQWTIDSAPGAGTTVRVAMRKETAP